MKKIIVAVLIMAAVAAFAGCTENTGGSSSTGSSSSAKVNRSVGDYDVQKAIRENKQIDKNAEVSTFVDRDGNKAFTYKNPDGGGGGGVVLD